MNLIRFNHSSPDFRVEGGRDLRQVQARLRHGAPPGGGPPGPDDRPVLHAPPSACLQGLRGLGPGEMDGLGHSDNTAVTCLEVEGDTARIVFENDNSHLPMRSPPWPASGGGRSGTEQAATQTCGSGPLNLKKEGR